MTVGSGSNSGTFSADKAVDYPITSVAHCALFQKIVYDDLTVIGRFLS
jgi:hypothetical protein